MKKIRTTRLLLLCLLFQLGAAAQGGAPFFNEIQAFKRADSLQPPPQNAIVFTGSSSFRLWPDLLSYFPNHTIINRAFGGSTLADLIHYERDVIFNYRPKQVVVYCGDNDLASSDTVTAQTVFERFVQLFTDIRKELPSASVVFVSIKPSPSRWKLKDKMKRANLLIEAFLRTKKNTAYVDVWPAMLGKDGLPKEEIFKEDKLHMNEKGYALWQKLIEPKLLSPSR